MNYVYGLHTQRGVSIYKCQYCLDYKDIYNTFYKGDNLPAQKSDSLFMKSDFKVQVSLFDVNFCHRLDRKMDDKIYFNFLREIASSSIFGQSEEATSEKFG